MQANVVEAVALVTVTWAVLGVGFTGIGLGVWRLFHLRTLRAESLLSCFWVGWAVTIAILQFWHLWFPVDWRARLVVALLSVGGFVCNARAIAAWGRSAFSSLGSWRSAFVVGIALFVFWLAQYATGPLWNGDTLLYHMNATRWASSYPIVPGLGNLEHRLAFNNSYFLYAAALEVGPWVGESRHVANGILLLALLLYLLAVVARLVENGRRTGSSAVFAAFLLSYVILLVTSPNHDESSLSPDLAVIALGIVATTQALSVLLGGERDVDHNRFLLFSVCLLTAVGVSVKLSFAPMGLSLMALMVAVCLRKAKMFAAHPLRLLELVVLPTFLLVS